MSKYEFNGVFNFEDKEAAAEIKRLQSELEDMTQQFQDAYDKAEQLEEELRQVKEEFTDFKFGNGLDVLQNKLETFQDTARKSAIEFKAFLRSVNLDDVNGTNTDQFDYYFDRIREGASTVNEAIVDVKNEYAALIQENFNKSGGAFDSQLLQAFSSSLETVGNTCNAILSKLQYLEENGIRSIGATASSESANVTNSLSSLQASLDQISEEAQGAYAPMVELLNTVIQYASIDDTKLYRVSEAFRGMAGIGQGHYGTTAINNLITLVQKLSSLGSNGALNMRFEAQGFNDLHIKKASYANLAEYLPKIANNTDTEKLEKLSHIDLSNFNNIKVSGAQLSGIAELVNALTQVQSIVSSSGDNGQDNDSQKDLQEIKKTISELERLRAARDRYRIDLERETGRYGTGSPETQSNYDAAAQSVEKLEAKLQGLRDAHYETTKGAKEYFDTFDAKAQESANKVQASLNKIRDTASTSTSKLTAKIFDEITKLRQSAARDPKAATMLDDLERMAKSGAVSYSELNKKLYETKQYINENDLAVQNWWQRMKQTFGSRMRSMLSGLIIGKVMMYFRDIYKNVVDIDTAMTQLKIVTGASDRQMEKFLSNSTKLAKELGATINEVLKSVETFSRLGYDLVDATELAKFSNILSKVAAVSSDEATKGLTSIIKGYGFDPSDASHISDVLVAVGQKYAVSAGELMEAYQKAGAALNASNTSFEKSAGLIAAANASIQDASVVGTALKTVSARIRKSKTDLDSLGESADDLAESWSTYANEIQALTGFDIMVEGSETQFKDIYDIFEGLSKAIGQLGEDADTARARVSEILGGTRQTSVISSILANWQDAAGAYATAMDAAGTSTKAMETYVNSIEGKIAQLKASFAELSNNILSSDVVKLVIDVFKGAVSAVNWVTKLLDKVIGMKSVLVTILGILVAIKGQKISQRITAGVNAIWGSFAKLTTSLIQAQMEGKTLGSVLKQSFASNPIGWVGLVTAGVSLLTGLITNAVNKIKQLREEEAQLALESAQKAIENAKSSREQVTSLNELIQKYKDLTTSGGSMDEVKSVQTAIVDLVGDQASQIDLVNGKYQDQLTLLKDISEEERKRATDNAKIALREAELAVSKSMTSKGGNGILEVPVTQELRIREELSAAGIDFWQGFNAKRGGLSLNLEENYQTAEEFASQYRAVLEYRRELLRQDNLDKVHEGFLTPLEKYLAAYRSEYETYIEARETYNKLTRADFAAGATSGVPIGTKTTLKLKTVADVLEQIQDKYDALVASMEDMNTYGSLTVKTFEDMNKNDLLDYLTQHQDGFTLNANALQDYVDSLIDAYYAEANLQTLTNEGRRIGIQNLENLRTALAMLAMSTDKAKSAAESQKDILKDQLDAYKELIDLRKELLKQYKEELDYKKELEKREQKVSSLQTQLAVSQLDNSAAGRARSRQLASELQSAQEELDDFTLEHAIEVVTNELDNQYEEYRKMIDDQLNAIEIKIGELTQIGMNISEYLATLPERVDSKIPNNVGVVSVKGGGGNRTNRAFLMTHHSGGIVGGVAKIKETEEFAKLLKGEFVATPNMMKRFMNFTLPAMAASGGNEFNAPLISITCDSISKDSIPTFQRIVNDAVSEIKRELDGGLNRSGYRKPAKKIAI